MTPLQRFKLLTAVLALALVVVLAFSSKEKMQAGQDQFEASLPKTISYQGHVEVDGEAFTGEGQFKFAIVDDGPMSPETKWTNDGSGMEDSSEPTLAVVLPVTNGTFSVLLGEEQPGMTQEISFVSFRGPSRILRVWFSHDGGSNFEELLPASRLSSVPFAMQADNAQTVGNFTAAQLVSLSKNDEISNLITVAKSGGDASSVQTAIDIALDKASAENPYLIYVAPGVYEEQIVMKPYVSIQGAGTLATIIRWKSDSMQGDSATVMGASNASLSNLRVEAAPASSDTPNVQPIAIYNDGASPILSDLDIRSSGGDIAIGISNQNGSKPKIKDAQVQASNEATAAYGILNNAQSDANLDNVSVDANTSETTVGVFNMASTSVMRDIEVHAKGGDFTRGILNRDGGYAKILRSRIEGQGGAKQNFGMLNLAGARFEISESFLSASGGASSLCTSLSNQDSSGHVIGSQIYSDPGRSCAASFGISNVLSEDNTDTRWIRIERSSVDGVTAGLVSPSPEILVDVSFSEIGGATGFDAPSAKCFFVTSRGTSSSGPDCP